MEFIKIRLKKTLLNELNLPDIDYPILPDVFSEGLREDNLPYAHILFGLQNIANVTPEVIRAKTELAQLLSPNDNREIITACGDDWWLELGPVDMNKEMVTIQQNHNLVAILQPREDGRLRVATYTMLDKRCLSMLMGASMIPHPQFGVCMRENNWEYIKDQSASIANFYADRNCDSYLSYWEFGLGISHDKSIVDNWYSQRELNPIKPQIVVTELGIYYMYGAFISDE